MRFSPKIEKPGSISVQIFIEIFSLSIIMLLALILLVQNTYIKTIEDNEINYHVERTNSTKDQFKSQVVQIDETAYSIIENDDIQRVLSRKTVFDESSDETKSIKTYLQTTKDNSFSINNVHVIGSNHFMCSTDPQFSDPKVHSIYMGFLQDYINGDPRIAKWTDFHTTGNDQYLSSISYIRPIFNSETKQIYGIVAIDISYESIHKIFTTSSIKMKDRAVIVGKDGDIVMQYSLQSDFHDLLRQFPQILDGPVQLKGKIYGIDAIIISEKLDISDWMLVRFIYKDVATKSLQKMLKNAQYIIGLIALISLLYTFLITQSITKPIKELKDVCDKVALGDYSTHVEKIHPNEFGQLGTTMNGMITRINTSFENERELQKKKAENEFEILQAQINPHFLYNTLDSIKWLALMQGVDNIAEMSTALINLLKYNLGKAESNTTLREEVESVSNYIVIQKYRYGDTFTFSTDVPEELQNCQILRFILQPLVENSIIHGFNDLREDYQIRISAETQDDNKLIIRVTDNGSGMDSAMINAINTGISKSTRFSQIGVNNVRERIKLYFGDAGNLIFESQPGESTTASIILPLH